MLHVYLDTDGKHLLRHPAVLLFQDLKDKLDETLIDDGLNKILPTIRGK